jgi:beta-glucanase (GH16 family)
LRTLNPRRRVIWAITTLVVAAVSSAGCVPASGRSGSSEPPGDVQGWRRVLVDRFDGSRLNRSIWGAYTGQPGGDPGGWWDPSHVVVAGGLLHLETYPDARHGGRWVSGGVSSAPGLEQRYGKYLVRFRMDGGFGVAGVLLLWPQHGDWPPEIDFAETGGDSSGRATLTATLHHGRSDHTIARTVRGDFTAWHVLGVEWTPGRLGYTLDGRRWATVRSAHVPAQNMEMDMQTQAGTCGDRWAPCPDATTPARVVLQVDWVVAYRRASRSEAIR